MDEVDVDVTARSKVNESIIIRKAYKRYTHNDVVLNGLNLTVPQGTIYALLGPSGCGKTTLLNCIVGLTSLDAGTIRIGVKKRSEIGYMPQFLSLHEPMTVYENFFFYGYLFGMKTEEIKSRANDLISFLELPSGNSKLKFLSGGEQRRVSIAIAFLHSPKILILDEPTVGLDPLLCQTIWNKMLDLIREGKSIIITTHYIQEAQQAQTIGLMRGGVLLAEENPQQLMEKYESTDLEEIFFNLSVQQNALSKTQDSDYPECKSPVKMLYEEDTEKFSSTKYLAIMYKNLVFFRREVAFIIFVIFLPTVQAYIFNLVVGVKPKHVKLGVVNDEIDYSKCNYSAYDGCYLDSNQNVSLSCLFLEYMQNKTYDFTIYNDSESALHDVRKNEVWALLHFRSNYTRSLAEMTELITNRHEHVDTETFINGFVNSWIDLSNQYIGSFIKYDITRSMLSLIEQSFINCGLNSRLGSIAISFETPIFGSYDENFITYASAAMLCLCCFFSSSTSTAMIIVTEKADGIMERMLVTGASMTEMILSLVLLQSIGQMISIPIVMLTMYYIFNNPLYGSAVTLVTLLGLTGFTGVLYGTTLAVLNKELKTTAYIGVGVNIVLCLTTGLLWPVEAQHSALKKFTWMLPLTWIADAARGITAKSYPFSHPLVLRGFASAIAWNIIFSSIIYFALRRQKGGKVKVMESN